MSSIESGKTTRKVLQLVIPAADTGYDVPLPPGSYYLSLSVDSNVTGTTTIITVRPLVDVSAAMVPGTIDFRMMEPDDATPIANLTLTASDEGRFVAVGALPSTGPFLVPIALPYGLQISIAKGTAVTAEKCKITLTATKVA